MNVLVVVDMQNDFVTGVLGSKEAVAIVPNVASRIAGAEERGEQVIFTRDTHGADYLNTQEGRKLPVEHCIRNTAGWEIVPELQEYAAGKRIFDKPTFGSVELSQALCAMHAENPVEKVTFIGLCTDICVISNAMLVKAALPETEVVVDAACCAGVTPESHNTALAAMSGCQIVIENA